MITHVGGRTALIKLDGWRLTDPTLAIASAIERSFA
jgi:hypothetical protein